MQWLTRSSISTDSTLSITLTQSYISTSYAISDIAFRTVNTSYVCSNASVYTSSVTTTGYKLVQDTRSDDGGINFTCGY